LGFGVDVDGIDEAIGVKGGEKGAVGTHRYFYAPEAFGRGPRRGAEGIVSGAAIGTWGDVNG
jgi:hypothetical protein